MRTLLRSAAVVCLALALTLPGGAAQAASLTRAPFGRTRDGKAVTRYTMTSALGIRVQFTSYGGIIGFDRRLWQAQPLATSGPSVSARLTYTSPNGEEGFPGTLKVRVTYTLSDDGVFTTYYGAVTDKDTVVALTNHASFNLAGAGSPGSVLTQVLQIDADRYLTTDKTQIPLGQLAPVQGTPFDFRRPTATGTHIHDKNAQLAIQGGYDQEWVLNKHSGLSKPQLAVRVYDPKSGRTLECLTTEPGVLSYTGGEFDGTVTGVGGRYRQFAAFTLETQHYPDSPNHPQFPTTELKPGQTYSSTTIFRFGVQR